MRDFRHPVSGLKRRFWAAGAACFAVAISMAAAMPFASAARASSCPDAVADNIFRIDSSRSQVAAKVRFFGLTTKTASFPKVAGRVSIPDGRSEGIRLDVLIDASMLKAGDDLTTNRLRSASFFNVERFPEVRLRGEHFVQTGPSAAQIIGVLTARGVSRPATLRLMFSKQIAAVRPTDTLDISGEMRLDRTLFGMTAYPLIVGREVTVRLKVHIVPEQTPSCRAAGGS
jgi:polyisoprenoid-binding protein YceI